MESTQSLDTFFRRSEPSTLDNCDREKIHLSGAIQNTGALLVIDPATQRIVGFTDNVTEILGIDPERLSEAVLGDINTDLAAQISELVDCNHILHEAVEFQLEHAGIAYDTVTHSHAGRRFVEFVPNSTPSAHASRKNMRLCSKACATILHSDSFDDAIQIAADAVRQISGFSRVDIYRFQPDWSGKVIAESNDGSLPSYLGLHFPERDIPRQVRHLMTLVPYRGIGTVSDNKLPVRAITFAGEAPDELDMTWSILRSVSPMHTQYLSNMGIASTFSTSLMHQGSLWGLIACHHSTPGFLPFDSWRLLTEIGTALMIRHTQQLHSDIASMSQRLRLIESEFSSALQQTGRVEELIDLLAPSLRKFLGAEGLAFLYNSNIHLSGRTPPEDFVRELLAWAGTHSEGSHQYHTSALQDEWPPATEHRETACGVLIQSTKLNRVCQLIWFRGPVTHEVEWAGQTGPRIPGVQSGVSDLNPRASFDRWVEEHDKQSAAWRESELQMSQDILRDFLDIITSQMLLNQENQYLRQFAASAAHDLRTPLRGINAALDIMHEEEFDAEVVKQTHAMATKSARRLADLTTGLMELSTTTEQKHVFAATDVAGTINDALEMLALPIRDTDAAITVDDMPVIHANDALLLRVFLNLIANALKYRFPDRTPVIHISAQADDSGTSRISITDNGMGIEAKYADRIFQPLERLHRNDEIEGSGLGLTICQRVAEAHSGSIRLDNDYQNGSRFILTIPPLT